MLNRLDFSEAFGARVREIMDRLEVGPNSVELKSGRRISHTTVRRMLRGYVPNSDLICEFGLAIGAEAAEINDLLELAGILYLRYTPDPVRSGTPDRNPRRGAVPSSARMTPAMA